MFFCVLCSSANNVYLRATIFQFFFHFAYFHHFYLYIWVGICLGSVCASFSLRILCFSILSNCHAIAIGVKFRRKCTRLIIWHSTKSISKMWQSTWNGINNIPQHTSTHHFHVNVSLILNKFRQKREKNKHNMRKMLKF